MKKIMLIFLVRTKLNDIRAKKEILQFGFDNCRDTSLTGFIRGMWLLWNSYICDIKIDVGTFHMSERQILIYYAS